MPQPCRSKSQQGKRATEGFSLIELVVVVFIISLLALVAIPIYNGHRLKATSLTGNSSVKMIKFNVEEKYFTTGSFPTSNAEISLGTGSSTTSDYSIAIGNVPAPGTITVTINAAPAGANTVTYVPSVAGYTIDWDCATHSSLAVDYRPYNCKP